MDTYAAQWFERTLDDSAIRRICIPQAYLCADASLILLNNISSGMVVYPAVIAKRVAAELPYVSTLPQISSQHLIHTTCAHRIPSPN